MTDAATTPTHEFNLVHVPCGYSQPTFNDLRYEALKTSPPAGCAPQDFDGQFGLRCQRAAPTLLDAVAEVCGEVNTAHGILMTDLGIEKLWEWVTDGPNGFGATLVGQLLLMASHRAQLVDYTTDDLVRFLQTIAPSQPGAGG